MMSFLLAEYLTQWNKASYLKGRCSAARSSAYFPLDMISLLKPIFSYSFPKLNFPKEKIWHIKNSKMHRPINIVMSKDENINIYGNIEGI